MEASHIMSDEIAKRVASAVHVNRTINVSVPAGILYDFEKMQDVTKGILGRLGCRACTSGFDIRYHLETEFIVRDLAGQIDLSPFTALVK